MMSKKGVGLRHDMHILQAACGICGVSVKLQAFVPEGMCTCFCRHRDCIVPAYFAVGAESLRRETRSVVLMLCILAGMEFDLQGHTACFARCNRCAHACTMRPACFLILYRVSAQRQTLAVLPHAAGKKEVHCAQN
jgi:hypothetical protein